MRIYDSKLWISELDEVLDRFPGIRDLAGKSVLITGATGLICSAAADLLIRCNDTQGTGIRILAAGRSAEKVLARFGARDDVTFVPYDATHPDGPLPDGCDYIIHGASNATPKTIMQEPVETMLSNFVGLRRLLEHARTHGTARVLYVSSSEVYGKKDDALPYREGQYGYIDLLNPRNSYPVSKRAAETLCASYAAEYGVDTAIVRPGHIYGPTATPNDYRVSSAWAYAAARGEDIVMKSDGAQLRSYCHCLDCASALFTVLLKGARTGAYNISNPASIITIRQMAELLTRAGGVRLKLELPAEEERKAFNPMSNSSLNSDALEALGWQGLFGAERGFAETVRILRETM